MASLGERWSKLFESISRGNPPSSAWLKVPDGHVLGVTGQAEPFQAGEHYFVVRIHQAHLAAARMWFSRYDPLLSMVTEFGYDGAVQREPFLVGPSTFKTDGHPTPAGMDFTDVRATDIRPYRGGPVNVTVILYRNKVSDAIRQLLSIAERCVAVPGLSAAAGPYIQYAEAGLDALESVLGLDDTVPMLGVMHGFDPLDRFGPGWFVLCESGALEEDEIWVRGNRLYRGPDPGRLTAVDGADFVLASLGQTRTRDNAEELAEFRRMWQPVMTYANLAGDESWSVAKALMAALQLAVRQSPDLIPSQTDALIQHYLEVMKALRREAMDRVMLGAPQPAQPDPLLHSLAQTLAG